jgi:uncharacterized membrane protein YheB (UPF0754 family)
MNYWLWSIPIISGCIGWIMNGIVIKMLFHPTKPIKIIGFTIQGIFPKRQQQLAQQIGQFVEQKLLSFKDIEQQITHPDQLQKIYSAIEPHIDYFLRTKLKEKMPIISMFIGEKTIQNMKEVFMEELQVLMPDLLSNYLKNLKDNLNVQQKLSQKISDLSIDKIESIFYQFMAKEIRLIKIAGAVLGFIIGIIQIGITLAIGR